MADRNNILRPLAGLKVIDVVTGPLAPITRYLGELGAEVIRLEPAASAAAAPHLTQDGLADRFANLGKTIRAVDFNDAAAVATALEGADLIVENVSLDPALAGRFDFDAVRRAHPQTVIMTVSPFGRGNSYTDWQMTDPVLHALSGELSRSGIRGRAPLPPPAQIALQCAIVQAAYVATLSLYASLTSGRGDHLDFSALDGAVQALDPGFGIGGSATLGVPAKLLPRDRPVKGFQYPILACADGHVRVCILATRQWRGMFKWMGEPEAFASEAFNSTVHRYRSPEFVPALAAFFADKKRADLQREGQAHGVPIAAMLTLDECLAADHLKVRNVFAEHAVADGVTAPFPAGVVEIDGERMAPGAPTQDAPSIVRPAARSAQPSARPLEGLKVLDLGVIVVGAEQSRLLADMGADVIKIESLAFPDGTRQSSLGNGLSVGFAAGHRNKRSLGLNLKHPEGIAIFKRLAAEADVILSNFKPGTMESLGLSHAELASINPAIITAQSSAFGSTGPWSKRMGYGPLVRATAGLTGMWCYPDDPDGYSDSITIYPDHVAARVGAMSVLGLMIRRLRTGHGGAASISQAEVMLSHLGAEIAGATLAKRGVPDFAWRDGPPDAPWGVFQASGDDEWCVVTVRNDEDWRRLAAVLERPDLAADPRLSDRSGRLDQATVLNAAVADWMAGQDAEAAMLRLQAAGVPAARMLRVGDQPDFGYYRERGLFRDDRHPLLDDEITSESMHVRSETLPQPDARPAPLMCEHSAEVLQDWLKFSEAEISDLVARQVVELTDPAILAMTKKTTTPRETAQ